MLCLDVNFKRSIRLGMKKLWQLLRYSTRERIFGFSFSAAQRSVVRDFWVWSVWSGRRFFWIHFWKLFEIFSEWFNKVAQNSNQKIFKNYVESICCEESAILVQVPTKYLKDPLKFLWKPLRGPEYFIEVPENTLWKDSEQTFEDNSTFVQGHRATTSLQNSFRLESEFTFAVSACLTVRPVLDLPQSTFKPD